MHTRMSAVVIGALTVFALAGCARERTTEVNILAVDQRSTQALAIAKEAQATAEKNNAAAEQALAMAKKAQADAAAAAEQARAANERADRTFQSSLRK